MSGKVKDFNAIASDNAPDLSGDPVVQTEVDLLCILADFPNLVSTVESSITEEMISDSEVGKLIKNFIFSGVILTHSIIEETLKSTAYCVKKNSFSVGDVEQILAAILHHYKLKYFSSKLPTKLMKSKDLASSALEIEKAQQILTKGAVSTKRFDKREAFAEAQQYQLTNDITFKTGIQSFDMVIRTGLMMSHLLVFAADTGVGKTLMCTQIVENIASTYGCKIAWFCLEMPRIDMVHRRIALYLKQSNFHQIIDKTIDELEYERALAIAENKEIYLYDDVFDFNSICAYIRNLSGAGFKFFVIDYLQLIRLSIPGFNERQVLDYMIIHLKELCKRYKISIIVVSQFSKGDDFKMKADASVVKREPMLRDLKGTSAIAQTADRVVMLWCPPEEIDGPLLLLPQRLIKWILLKNRHGSPGKGWIVHDKDTGRMSDASEERIQQYITYKEQQEKSQNARYNNRAPKF
jgi:replicative DNA helicase